jgi:hypothetical protein
MTRNPSTDEVAAFTALTSLIRGWGHDYAYAAESRLMNSVDAFIYREVWRYCRAKSGGRAKRAYAKYTRPRTVCTAGTFQLGLVVGNHVVQLPRLSNIPRKGLKLGSPPPVSLLQGREDTLSFSGTTDERWGDRHGWGGQEGRRRGQRRLAVEVLAKDTTCQRGHEHPATQVHHDPPWRDHHKHNPKAAYGVCAPCHRQMLKDVVKSDGEPRESKDTCGVRASGGG